MWKAFALVASAIGFSLIGLLVAWNSSSNNRFLGAAVGCWGGLMIGCLAIAVAVEKPKP